MNLNIEIPDGVYKVLKEKAEKSGMPQRRWIIKSILDHQSPGDCCQYKKAWYDLKNKMNKISAFCHSGDGHHPEYAVMLIEMEKIEKELL